MDVLQSLVVVSRLLKAILGGTTGKFVVTPCCCRTSGMGFPKVYPLWVALTGCFKGVIVLSAPGTLTILLGCIVFFSIELSAYKSLNLE